MLSDTSFQVFIGRGAKFALGLMLGVCALAILFITIVPIPRSVVASGVVSPIRATRLVQHDSGGIVETLPVIDGQRIQKGDMILQFETTALEAEKLALATEIVSLSAERESLISKNATADANAFSDPLRQLAYSYDLESDLDNQAARASAKRQVNAELTAGLEEDLSTLQQRRQSLIAQRVAKREERRLMEDLIARREPLVADGFVAEAELNQMQIQAASLRSTIERLNGEIADTEGAIAKAESNLVRAPQELNFERLSRLAELTRQIADRKKRMTQVDRAIAKSVVSAPVSGQVIGLGVNTIGGYVAPGQEIAMIVPDNEELIIDVRLNPRDIDIVVAGMDAKVVFSAFPQRKLPEISAEIESIASDVLVDNATGVSYYQTRMTIPDGLAQVLSDDDDLELLPGMPVDVFIPVNRTSVLQYIWTPVRQSFRSSFRA